MSVGRVGNMRFEAGQVVNGKYEILESLGQGGMNDAYKARDNETGRLVVLKIPFASLIGDPSTSASILTPSAELASVKLSCRPRMIG